MQLREHSLRHQLQRWMFSRGRLKYFCVVLGFLGVVICDFFGLLTPFFELDYFSQFSYPLELDIQDILNQAEVGRMPDIPPINEYRFPYLIENREKCSAIENASGHEVVLLFVIKSAIDNRDRRDAIRDTWGSETRWPAGSVRRIFVLGNRPNDEGVQSRIEAEQQTMRDILQADFVDSYYNNTMKTMLAFKWVFYHCPKVRFFMFVDDDMYISAKNTLRFLCILSKERAVKGAEIGVPLVCNSPVLNATVPEGRALGAQIPGSVDGVGWKPNAKILVGYVKFAKPVRDKSSKWYIPLRDYPYSMYPPYLPAGGYILSYPALRDMYVTSLYTKHFRFDDIFLAIVAKKAGITPIHNENFKFWKNPDSFKDVIASHGFDATDLRTVWLQQEAVGNA